MSLVVTLAFVIRLKFIFTKGFKTELKISNINDDEQFIYKRISNSSCYFVAESFRAFYFFIFNFFYCIQSLIHKTDDLLIKS